MFTNFFSKNKTTTKEIHFLFLFVLSLNYIVPLLIFNKITLFYLDHLDSEIVYNSVIGQILKGDFKFANIFLGGEIKIEYLRRVLQPYMILYSIFNTELAYWLVDILVKLTSYFSFFILARKINQNLFICGLISCLFASSNLPTHEGFGLAIMPYLSYLILYKDNLKFKHYFTIIFFGLNTDIVMTGISIPALALFFFLFVKKEKYIQLLKILTLFSICILIANSNIVFVAFQAEQLHRAEMARQSFSLYNSVFNFFSILFKIPASFEINFSNLKSFSYSLFVVPLMIGFFFSKDKNVRAPLYAVILIAVFLAFLEYEMIALYIDNVQNLFKTISWNYLDRCFLFLFSFSLIYILKKKDLYAKILIYFVCLSVFSFQVNSSVVPFVKDKILNVKNYQNLYTFKGYYYFYDYPSIKMIVQNERTISVGLDPMVAVFHKIKVIDGYHSIYPLAYKNKFRKIIEKELDSNLRFKKYYDSWGSRVYATLYQPKDLNNIQLNFKAAKKLGAKFVISKYSLNSADLSLISEDCVKKKICLYRIN